MGRHRRGLEVTPAPGYGLSGLRDLGPLVKLGFEVRELIGGLVWWKRDGYATAGSKACDGRAVACGC